MKALAEATDWSSRHSRELWANLALRFRHDRYLAGTSLTSDRLETLWQGKIWGGKSRLEMEESHRKLVLDLALVYTHQLLVSTHDDFIHSSDEAKEKPCYHIMPC